MTPSWKKRRKEKLFKKNPYCHWCGDKMVFYPLKSHEKMPSNYATLGSNPRCRLMFCVKEVRTPIQLLEAKKKELLTK